MLAGHAVGIADYHHGTPVLSYVTANRQCALAIIDEFTLHVNVTQHDTAMKYRFIMGGPRHCYEAGYCLAGDANRRY